MLMLQLSLPAAKEHPFLIPRLSGPIRQSLYVYDKFIELSLVEHESLTNPVAHPQPESRFPLTALSIRFCCKNFYLIKKGANRIASDKTKGHRVPGGPTFWLLEQDSNL